MFGDLPQFEKTHRQIMLPRNIKKKKQEKNKKKCMLLIYKYIDRQIDTGLLYHLLP